MFECEPCGDEISDNWSPAQAATTSGTKGLKKKSGRTDSNRSLLLPKPKASAPEIKRAVLLLRLLALGRIPNR